jgi:hypothetical protein
MLLFFLNEERLLLKQPMAMDPGVEDQDIAIIVYTQREMS